MSLIHKLKKSEYHTVGNLMAGVKNFPEVYAVTNRINPGEVYVDNNNPKSALVWNQGMQGFYFIGEVNNDKFKRNIKEYVNDTLLNELLDKGINWFEISSISDIWYEIIEEIFADRNIQYEHQLVNRMSEKPDDLLKDASSGDYNIQKMDREVLQTNITNLEFITDELELFWGTLENFFSNGTCYFAVEDNKAVSICYSGFRANNIETIGIETLSEYRKKGYAYELGIKFIEDCNERNVIPYWDCSKENIGSRRLAEKLGFEKTAEYRCYWFNF